MRYSIGFPLGDTYYRRRPKVTLGLIIANVIIYLITSYSNFFIEIDDYWVNAGAFVPALLEDPTQWYRIFTSMFMHGDIFHIFFNMYFLYIFGRAAEDVLGGPRYLTLYLTSGVAASLFHVAFSFLGGLTSYVIPAIGASGAISGVLGAYLIFYPGTSLTACWIFFIFPACFSLRASLYLIFWFVTQVLYGFARISGGVAVFAHAGGFLAGMALLPLLVDRERLRELKFVEYVRSLPYLILTYPKVRGLSRLSKTVLSIVIISVIVGGAYVLTALPRMGVVKVMNVQYTYMETPYRDYAAIQLPDVQSFIADIPLSSTRILLSRLNAAGLLYDPGKAGTSLSLSDRSFPIRVLAGNRWRDLSMTVEYFGGSYDEEGFLKHGEGSMVTQVVVIQGNLVSVIDGVKYTFTIDTQTVSPNDVSQYAGMASLAFAVGALMVVVSRDKELALVGE
ncbi:MAG: rhomboid family intramembrane serine protease [Zestosphaera sp.]